MSDYMYCPLCGEELDSFTVTVIRTLTQVTCFNSACPIEGRTLSPADHSQLAESTRQDIVLRWTFEQCLARPCPMTLTTALTLMMAEAHRHDNADRLLLQYREFAAVCQHPVLVQQAAGMWASYTACFPRKPGEV